MTGNSPKRSLSVSHRPVPVIDLFAGPGGLGEGFSAVRTAHGTAQFRLALSVEKDPIAHQTLELRVFFRQFGEGQTPAEYYEYAKGAITRHELFALYPEEADRARKEAWCAELGPETRTALGARVRALTATSALSVLIGGPPCQAYSLVGRARNRGKADYDPDQDKRHTLYVEYLHVIASQWPAVFVMENVKGLLSAKFENESMFERIIRDLQDPVAALSENTGASARSVPDGRKRSAQRHTYRLQPLVQYEKRPPSLFDEDDAPATSPRNFIVRAEKHGVPQARHRVIILGVRDDIAIPADLRLRTSTAPTVQEAIGTLPPLRSGLSREDDCLEDWRRVLAEGLTRKWFSVLKTKAPNVTKTMRLAVQHASEAELSRGVEVLLRKARTPAALKDWYATASTPVTLNHATRAHIASDLHRYLFAASFAEVTGRSPTLADFPRALLPNHENARDAIAGSLFNDRFRVQIAGAPSTTITSHISKDGHYYIHYDPSQCRSLTVREAARLQTFPDNYFFCGPRTSQYHQVGNAVPPYLAYQIAEVVAGILRHHEEVTRTGDG